MDFDVTLRNIGQFGRFQKYLLLLIAIPCMISSWQSFLHAFVGYIPPHRCWIEHCDNATTKYWESWVNGTIPFEWKDGVFRPDQCRYFSNTSQECPPSSLKSKLIKECRKWKYDDSQFSSTIATKWNLVCHKEYLVSVTGSVNMAGGFIGSILMGAIGDRFGRKIAILITLAFLAIFGTAAALSPNVYIFMGFRFLIEMMESSLFYGSFILVMEFIGPDKRVFASQAIQLIYTFGEMALAGIAYCITDWHMLQLATSLPSLIFLSFYWMLPESARWLMARGKSTEATDILKKMTKWNKGILGEEMGVHYGTVQEVENSPIKTPDYSSCDETENFTKSVECSYSAVDLFKTPRLRIRTVLLMLCWFMNVLVYTGITLGATAISDNAYLSFFFSGLVELPANLLAILAMNYFGRRITLCTSFALTGIALLMIQFVPDNPKFTWLLLVLTLIGKFGSTAGNGVLYLFSAEIFPTVLRNSGLGVCGFVGTFASTIAPEMRLFGQVTESLPYILFGAGSIIGGIASLTQPETLNRNLPQTVEDAEKFGT